MELKISLAGREDLYVVCTAVELIEAVPHWDNSELRLERCSEGYVDLQLVDEPNSITIRLGEIVAETRKFPRDYHRPRVPYTATVLGRA